MRDDGKLGPGWNTCVTRSERAMLLTDVLSERGDIFLEHEAAGCPPVLFYDYETAMEGRDLPLKSNYVLLRVSAARIGRASAEGALAR
ncbi:DUF3141 domain-containing protein [Bradyrhizobium sp. BRP22]|nr:DUF3141 domain-containing protein [Bradyrhizobium sp. BRP22]